MKHAMSLFLLAFVLVIAVPQKSEAAVGYLIKHRTTRVVGGVIGASGVAVVAGALIYSKIWAGSWATLGYAAMGTIGAGVGLVILDEKNADFKFRPLSDEEALSIEITDVELAVYNSEVAELNAIKEVIESKVSDDVSEQEATAHWDEYKPYLAPETLKVAGLVSLKIFQ